MYLFTALQALTGGSIAAAQVGGATGPVHYRTWSVGAIVLAEPRLYVGSGGTLPSACQNYSNPGTTPTPLQNIQAIFAGVYLLTQAAVLALYIRTRALPPWTLCLLCLSRRVHSIFLLRLFNDCWAMLLAYAATLLLQVMLSWEVPYVAVPTSWVACFVMLHILSVHEFCSCLHL